MAYCTGSHTKFYHRYHIVWVTKYRFKVLHGDMRVRLREIIRQTCSEMGVRIEKGVLSNDHVHMFVSIPPQGAFPNENSLLKLLYMGIQNASKNGPCHCKTGI